MKKFLVVLLALSLFAATFVLGGCGGNDKTDKPDGAFSEPSDAAQENVPDADQMSDAFVDCTLKHRDAFERSDGDYTLVYEINCGGGEYIEHYYLFCDAEMSGLRCVGVDMDEEGRFIQNGIYSQIESVKPGEAIYISLEVPEVIPNTAIVYTGADGMEYIWLIGYNGRDGGISLVPIGVNQLITE